MRVKLGIFLYFMFVLSGLVSAIDVYVADPYLHSAPNEEGLPYRLSEQAMSIGEELFRQIQQRDHKGLLNLYKSDIEIRSMIDAAELLLLRKADFMLYGDYYQESLQRATLTIKLYDKAAQENKKIFYVTGHPEDVEAIYVKMAEEIVHYFYLMFDVLNVSQNHLYEGFVFTPLLGSLFHLTNHDRFIGTGVAGLELRYRLRSFKQKFLKFPRFTPYFLGSASYGFSLNQPDYYNTHYHQAQLGLGLGISMELKHKHLFLSDLRYASDVSMLFIDRINKESVRQIMHAPGLTANLGYEYWMNNRRVGFGVHNQFHVAFYKQSSPLVTYRLLLSMSIALPPRATLKEERQRAESILRDEENSQGEDSEGPNMEEKDDAI